jgi:hypothetical protein
VEAPAGGGTRPPGNARTPALTFGTGAVLGKPVVMRMGGTSDSEGWTGFVFISLDGTTSSRAIPFSFTSSGRLGVEEESRRYIVAKKEWKKRKKKRELLVHGKKIDPLCGF